MDGALPRPVVPPRTARASGGRLPRIVTVCRDLPRGRPPSGPGRAEPGAGL